MKRKILISSTMLALLVIVFGCNEFDKLTQFNMEYNETINIPAASGIDLPVNTEIPDVETNSQSTFSVNNTHKDLIEEVKLSECGLTVTAPADGDLSFLKSITIYMQADGLEEVKVAWKDSIPTDCGSTLTLETGDTNLREYILKDSFDFRVNTVIRKIISSDYSIDLHSVFFVDAEILGQ